MTDLGGGRAPYLQFDVEHRRNDLFLRCAFGLTAAWTVLFGPSGAGKTSILRLIAGLNAPLGRIDRGLVIFEGRALLDAQRGVSIHPALRGIGFVSQRPALFPHMSVAENVAFGLHGLDRGAQRERVTAMLSLCAANEIAYRKPAALSAGEKQRAALARALAPQPRMLLLDEPFSAMDADLKESILSNLTDWLAQRRIPVLYVTHDIGEAFRSATEVIVLRKGEIQQQGAPEKVLALERQRLLDQLQGLGAPSSKLS